MAVTPLLPSQLLVPPSPLAAVPSVLATEKSDQNSQQRLLHRGDLAKVIDAGLAEDVAGQTVKLAKDLPPLSTQDTGAQGHAAANSSTTLVSVAGQLIGQLLNLAESGQLPNAVQGKTPILATPPHSGDTPQAASALREVLEQSGVFYESHVAEWAHNERPLASLMREPQARLADPAPAAEAASTAVAATTAATADSASADVAQIVNQQLNVLEQNRIVWQGQIWPGQTMTWEVREETSNGREDEGTEGGGDRQAWRSDLRFELPNLGAVVARIYWIDGHVQVQVAAADESAAASLGANGAQLDNALGSAGLKLDSLQVQVDKPA